MRWDDSFINFLKYRQTCLVAADWELGIVYASPPGELIVRSICCGHIFFTPFSSVRVGSTCGRPCGCGLCLQVPVVVALAGFANHAISVGSSVSGGLSPVLIRCLPSSTRIVSVGYTWNSVAWGLRLQRMMRDLTGSEPARQTYPHSFQYFPMPAITRFLFLYGPCFEHWIYSCSVFIFARFWLCAIPGNLSWQAVWLH